MDVRFGPAGNCELFYESGYKKTYEMPQFLHEIGLDAYEIQCGRGVRMGDEAAAKIKDLAKEYDIALSVHAPYYISLSGIDPLKRQKSIDYILESAGLAKKTGAKRIVIHSGSCSKITRAEALDLAIDTLKKAVLAMDEHGFSDITLCPETMGKVNQLGSLDEVIALCQIDERLIPTIDFGHLNARDCGVLKTVEDFEGVLSKIETGLGAYRAKNFHSHFSKIEYTTGGERRHLTFEDNEYGPEFEPLAEVIYKRGATPIFICESAGTMSKDALAMQKIFRNISHEGK